MVVQLLFVGDSYVTVQWQIMECTERCVAVSEPGSPLMVAMKYLKSGDSAETRQLARDIIRWECRPYPTMQLPPLGYIVKFTSICIVGLPLFKCVICHTGLVLICCRIKYLFKLGWCRTEVEDAWRNLINHGF